MTKYYRGNIRSYAAFWVAFRDLPGDQRFNAFVDFYKIVKQQVDAAEYI